MNERMKKKLIIVMLLTILILLMGCTSEEAQHVIDRIDNIGTIHMLSGKQLDEIGQQYDALNDDEKEQVVNYEIYEKAVEEYESYMKSTVDEVVEELSYYEPRECENKKDKLFIYYDYMSDEQKRECLARYLFYEEVPDKVELSMKYNLRDPDSFISYGKSASSEITYNPESDTFKGSVHISYGGSNLFGATVRKSRDVIVVFSIDIENKDLIIQDIKD